MKSRVSIREMCINAIVLLLLQSMSSVLITSYISIYVSNCMNLPDLTRARYMST